MQSVSYQAAASTTAPAVGQSVIGGNIAVPPGTYIVACVIMFSAGVAALDITNYQLYADDTPVPGALIIHQANNAQAGDPYNAYVRFAVQANASLDIRALALSAATVIARLVAMPVSSPDQIQP